MKNAMGPRVVVVFGDEDETEKVSRPDFGRFRTVDSLPQCMPRMWNGSGCIAWFWLSP